MGHHQQWIPGRADHAATIIFGLHPDASEALDELCVRRPAVVGYAAGHTHRHRVRPMVRSGVASIEVGCTKDFPGTWAEYRVFEGGVMQAVHRMSSEAALEWSESCRIYADFGVDYEAYAVRHARRPLLRHPVPLTPSPLTGHAWPRTRSDQSRRRQRRIP